MTNLFVTEDVLFETDEYVVVPFPQGLPVPLGHSGEILKVDGYKVIHKDTGLSNAETRNLSEAMVIAYKSTEDIKAVRQANSGIERVSPRIQGAH